MQKRITILVFSMLICSLAFCQMKKNSISFSSGAALPISDLGNSIYFNRDPEFTKLGVHLNFSFEHKINNTFSVCAMIHGQSNAIKTKAYESRLSNQAYYIPNYRYNSVKFPNWKLSKDKWLTSGFLIGGSNEFPIAGKKHRLSLFIKSMIGMVYSKSPNITGSSITDTTLATISIDSKSAVGLSYLFGSGLQYNFASRYFILFETQYFSTSKLQYKEVKETFTGAVFPYSKFGYSLTDDLIQSNNTTINFNVGIGVRL